MASVPQPEFPTPSTPTQPDAPAPEIQTPAPDIDVPDAMPGGEPATSPPQPLGFDVAGASSSDVGVRNPGDIGDIGSTEGMTAATGGLAGTSR